MAELAREKLLKKYPGAQIVGTHDGYFQKDGPENDEVIRLVNEATPDILFVCFGVPAQENWIASYRSRMPSVKVFAGLAEASTAMRSRKKSAVLLYQVQPGVVLPADKGTPPYRPYDEAPEVYLRYGYLPPDRTRPLQGLRLQPNFKSRHPLDPEPFGVFPDTASQAQQREIRPQGLNRSRGGLPFPAQRMGC